MNENSRSIESDIITTGKINFVLGERLIVNCSLETPQPPVSDSKEPLTVNIDWEPFRKKVEKTVAKKRFRTLKCPECGGEIYVVEYYDDKEAFVSCGSCSEYYHAAVKQGHTLKIGRFIIGTSVVIKSLIWDTYLKEEKN